MFPSYPVFTEGMHPGEFIVSEANGWRSRDQGILASGQENVPAGTVLGQLSADANEVQTITIGGSPTGGDYTLTLDQQTTAAIAYNANAAAIQAALVALPNIGAGGVTVTGSGPFTATFGGALADTEVDQLVADASGLTGGTNPSVTIATSTQGEPSNRYTTCNPGASDGSQTATALLFATTDATNGDARCVVISRDAEVNAAEITYPSGASATQIATINEQLATNGIIVRPAV